MSNNRRSDGSNAEAYDAPANIIAQPTKRATNRLPHPDPTVTPEEAYASQDRDAPVPNRSAYIWGAVIVLAIIILYLVLR
jgi:hypothetical protein